MSNERRPNESDIFGSGTFLDTIFPARYNRASHGGKGSLLSQCAGELVLFFTDSYGLHAFVDAQRDAWKCAWGGRAAEVAV
jgi:hypothetical protein